MIISSEDTPEHQSPTVLPPELWDGAPSAPECVSCALSPWLLPDSGSDHFFFIFVTPPRLQKRPPKLTLLHPVFTSPSSRYPYWASQVPVAVKNPPASAGNVRDVGSVPGFGRSGEGDGYPPQYSWLENPINRGSWQAIVHRVSWGCKESDTTERLSTHMFFMLLRKAPF